jgi:hypothetical protein
VGCNLLLGSDVKQDGLLGPTGVGYIHISRKQIGVRLFEAGALIRQPTPGADMLIRMVLFDGAGAGYEK